MSAHGFPFDFDLPEQLIAQEPASRRDHARLLVVHRGPGTFEHRCIADLPQLLQAGDLLVLNDTRVLPARLLGRRLPSGGKWEGLFVRELEGGDWEMLCQTGGKPLPGQIIAVEPGPLQLRYMDRLPSGAWRLRPLEKASTVELLQRHGSMPLPPYIRQGRARAEDRDWYQTVFANKEGAVAAPTAGLHFTPELFARLEEHGVSRSFITLHVGPGTFQPVKVDDYHQHVMHAEWAELPHTAVQAIAECRRQLGRVVAVGSTSLRVLETAANRGALAVWSGETDLFIYPPYQFKIADVLLTNFHLPRSTLLLLVAAFAGVELTARAYRAALEARYRFFSYGDAMLILP